MPAGQSDVREKTRARFDEVLRRYTNPPSEKKKSKQRVDQLPEDVVLQTLRKKLDLSKDTEEDETILNNTYNPAQASPRFSKNRRREEEVSEKANVISNEKPPVTSGKKKSKRTLPPPPTSIHDEEQTDQSAQRIETDWGEKRRGKRGKRRGGVDGGGQGAESEPGDDLLQKYQQQISQEEEKAEKTTAQKKHGEELPQSQEGRVLNNELGKKQKKKKNMMTNEGDESQSEVTADNNKSKESVLSDTAEEDKEGTTKSKRKIKKKRKEVIAEESQAEGDMSRRQGFDESLVLGVYIHRTDRLKTDFLVSHPMVKVHVVDEMTGHYVKKEDGHRRVSSFYEQEDIEHILPIITQPFDFKKNKSTVPEWEEPIIFNERFGYFLQDGTESPQVILFFEVLDFMSMDEARANPSVAQHERGFRKIAWAFLKLVGTNGMLNINSKLRLQLYSPPPRVKKTPQTVDVFHWWSKYPRNRYASTLYVTVKGIKPPEHVDPGIRSMMALQQERGSSTYNEHHTDLSQKSESRTQPTRWSRVPGQVCRIPNKLMLSLRGGHMGCFTLRFSHDGLALAAACADRDAFPVVVYEIPSGKVLASFNGHLNIVYDLCWTRDDKHLLSASSDGTVRVWNVERLQGLAQKILPHPSFLYCVQCHPHMQTLVVTGGFDCLLRVWNLDVKDVNGQLLQEVEGHKSFVNAMCFDSEGTRMFSADSTGLIIVWNTKTEAGSRHGTTRHWSIEKQIRESDLNGISINSLELHPNGRRLLVHAKDSVLRVMDLRILAVKKYVGATNYKERINSTFSPCGGFIYSGSEDGLAYVWNAETGDQVAVYSELGYPTALRGVAYHPHEHMVAFCAFGQSQPIHLYLYDRNVALLEVESMRDLSNAETRDSNPVANPSDLLPLQNTSVSGMDRFTSAARMSLKMQRVKQKLDSVLEPHYSLAGLEYHEEQGGMNETGRSIIQQGLNVFLPPPPLVSPHSKLHLSSSLSAHLIPQATLSSQKFGFTAVGQASGRVPSLKQRILPDQEFLLKAEDNLAQVHQTVVSLYDYRASRSDELTFQRGDVINVLYKDNDNWWFGCLASGQRGYFPTAYVAEERGFDADVSQAIEAQRPSEQSSQGVHKLAPAKLSAAISTTGELKIISEQDTDVEAPSAKMKKKKKKMKKSEISCELPQRELSHPEVSEASTKKKRPLPRLAISSTFESDATSQK